MDGEVTSKTYELADVTDAMGTALKTMPQADRQKAERGIFIFTEHVIAALKTMPDKPPRLPQKSED